MASASVELNDVVNTPEEFVVPLTGENAQLLPTEHDGVTVAPLTGLPSPSRTVTVTAVAAVPFTQLVEHAVIDDVVADTVEVVKLTAAALTVTAAVCVIPTALAVALTVFACAVAELNVAVKAPVAFVVPLADGANALFVPVAAIVTFAPGITFPN